MSSPVDDLSVASGPSRALTAARRLHALGRMATAGARRGRGLGWPWFESSAFALAGVLTIGWCSLLGAGGAADLLALRLLAYASWLQGFAVWSRMGEPTSPAEHALAGLRGRAPLRPEHFAWALGERAAFGALLATLPICAAAVVALPPGASDAVRFGLLPFALGYSLLLALGLAAVAAVARRHAPRAPRLAAAGLVLVPWAASLLVPAFPHLPGLYGALLDAMAELGGEPPP